MKLHDYQKKIVSFLTQHRNAILSVDMGLGKTISVLIFLERYMPAATGIIIAPKRVAETVWLQEAQKWELNIAERMVIIKGEPNKRRALWAAEGKTIKVVSREYIKEIDKSIAYDFVVFDELTSFKNPIAARTTAAYKINARHKIGLTGTFLANGSIDIFAQAEVCGLNKWRLNFWQWRATYFRDVLKGSGLAFSKWAPTKPLEEILQPLKNDIFTLTADDYLNIPKVVEQVVKCPVSQKARKQIADMDAFLATEIGGEMIAIKERAKFAKLQQLCNGFMYVDDDKAVRADGDKLRVVCDLVTRLVDNGEKVLLFYAYREEALWLHDMLLQAGIDNIRSVKSGDFIDDWNTGKINVLFAHPASAGHGLNLQNGGSVCVWSTLTYNYELFAQGNARLARQGQKRVVRFYYCVAEGTCEEKIISVLTKKQAEQRHFLDITK